MYDDRLLKIDNKITDKEISDLNKEISDMVERAIEEIPDQEVPSIMFRSPCMICFKEMSKKNKGKEVWTADEYLFCQCEKRKIK